MSKVELLSPAGSFEALRAAVANGTDAVYLGTQDFNARINARNFSLEELVQAVAFCHRKGVRVYLTLNTLVKNQEIKPFFDTLARAYALGIDGVIIQHISFLDIIKKSFPGLAVFISTQAAITSSAAASLLKSADRVILPREMPLAEIKKIIGSGVKVEVFIHGALCFGYSGLCLFSSFVGHRSGNRGSCAQLCRQQYNGAYPLSTRELCLVRRLPELIEAGISGFKIEGRMRSPLYVAVATRLYRKAIDSYFTGNFTVPEKELAEIKVVFNRDFTEGLIFRETGLISAEKPMNRGAFLGVIENGEISLRRPVAVGDGVGVWQDGAVSGAVIRQMTAAGMPVNSAKAGDRVSLGITANEGSNIFLTSSPRILLEPDFTINRPAIPEPKRPKVIPALPIINPTRPSTLKMLVKAYSLAEAREAAQGGADIVFYDIFASDFPNDEFGAYLPRIMNDEELSNTLARLKEKKPAAILSGNAGILAYRAGIEIPIYLDYSLNTFNDLDLLFFKKYAAVPVLSPELALAEMAQFRDKDAVILCHGDIVLMNTKIELKAARLADDKGLVFPVRKEDGYRQILNSRPFGMFNDIRKLLDAGFSQFLIDKAGEGARFVRVYREMLKEEKPDRRLRKGYTAGHLYRPVS